MGLGQTDAELIGRAVTRLHAGVTAGVCGLLGGLGLFVMTVWLLIKDGPLVGPHLQLLANYFIGYSVTWGGSLLGLVYGAVAGGLVGWTLAAIYNKIVGLRIGSVAAELQRGLTPCGRGQGTGR